MITLYGAISIFDEHCRIASGIILAELAVQMESVLWMFEKLVAEKKMKIGP